MPLAGDRSLPVDVRYLRLSSRACCLADHVLSQLLPSLPSGASIPVCYLSCHVFAIANCHFSQPSSSPDPAVVVSGSRRSAILGCAAVGAEFAVRGVASGSGVPGFGWRRHFCMFGCGLVGSGLIVGVCRFYVLYLVYLECLPMLLSVSAWCHCDRCFCHSPRPVSVHIHVLAVCTLCSRCAHAYGFFVAVRTPDGFSSPGSSGSFRGRRVLSDRRDKCVHASHTYHGTIFFS
jgi:hypothetical protein